MSKKYQRRVSGLIQNHLMTLLGRRAKDPRLSMVTITDVVVTPDAAHADVHYSLLGDEEERAQVQEGLESAAGWMRRELGRTLRLRNTPELHFYFDPSLERGERIESILDDLGLGDSRMASDTDEADSDEQQRAGAG